jgi:hypothetical protein
MVCFNESCNWVGSFFNLDEPLNLSTLQTYTLSIRTNSSCVLPFVRCTTQGPINWLWESEQQKNERFRQLSSFSSPLIKFPFHSRINPAIWFTTEKSQKEKQRASIRQWISICYHSNHQAKPFGIFGTPGGAATLDTTNASEDNDGWHAINDLIK